MRIIVLSVLSAMLALAPCRALGDSGGGSAGKEGMLAVQRTEVKVVHAVPVQVSVVVHGVLLNGCSEVSAIKQSRVDHAITVAIAIHTTAEVCTMMARLVEEKVPLEGEFKPGLYTVNVNGTLKKFRVRSGSGQAQTNPAGS